jgi:hypothetical protein
MESGWLEYKSHRSNKIVDNCLAVLVLVFDNFDMVVGLVVVVDNY